DQKTSSRFLRNTTCQIQGSHQVHACRSSWKWGCLTGDFRCHSGGHAITKQDEFILRRYCHHR
ncbi:hypothetical protein, partial [Holospora undulata]|uniref:hypothetical protein n=1 Tax=Holospora undulata TaxID=1169117 RepID=UPI001377905A